MSEVHESNRIKLLSYADDLLMIIGIDEIKNTKEINNKIQIINDVLHSMELGLNPNKIQMLSRRYNENQFKREIEKEIKMNQENFKFNPEMKYLGIILGPKPNYNKHVEDIIGKIKKYYNKIRALYSNVMYIGYLNAKITKTLCTQRTKTMCTYMWFGQHRFCSDYPEVLIIGRLIYCFR